MTGQVFSDDVVSREVSAATSIVPVSPQRAGVLFALRPPSPLDKAAGHTGMALGLGPVPDPGNDSLARRIGLGLFGTLASIIWMWSLTPPAL